MGIDKLISLGFYELEKDKEWVALPNAYEELYIMYERQLLRPRQTHIALYSVYWCRTYRKGTKTVQLVHCKPLNHCFFKVEQFIKKRYGNKLNQGGG